MKKLGRKNRSKIAMTLVELVVAMALTSLFATACVMLIYPIEKIYTTTTDLARAQLIADTVADSLRKECASAYIEGEGDVWIGETGNAVNPAASAASSGSVLVFRKNKSYCETIYANDVVPKTAYDTLKADSELVDGNVSSRAIFRLFASANNPDIEKDYVHFGYYKSDGGKTTPVIPSEYYDFTNPFTSATYREYKVALTFSGIGLDQDDKPSYVLCQIDIKKGEEIVYTRNTVLCFAAPVQ